MLGAIPEVRWEILNQIILNTPEAQGKKLLMGLEQIRSFMETQMPAQSTTVSTASEQNGSSVTNPTLKSALGLKGVQSGGIT